MEPMANSSMLVLPISTAPALSRFRTASAVKAGTKLSSIREAQVVLIPSVHRLSLTAMGTPASGPLNSPASIRRCTCTALSMAPSLSMVT